VAQVQLAQAQAAQVVVAEGQQVMVEMLLEILVALVVLVAVQVGARLPAVLAAMAEQESSFFFIRME